MQNPYTHAGKQLARTRVLLSSIFFMADSVVSGYFTIWNESSFCGAGALHAPQERVRHTLVLHIYGVRRMQTSLSSLPHMVCCSFKCKC